MAQLPVGTAIGSSNKGTIRQGIGTSTYLDTSTSSKTSAIQTKITTIKGRGVSTSRGGGSGGGQSTEGGYVLPTGETVPVTPAITKAIQTGQTTQQIKIIAQNEAIRNKNAQAIAQSQVRNSSYYLSPSYKEKKIFQLKQQGYSEKEARYNVSQAQSQVYANKTYQPQQHQTVQVQLQNQSQPSFSFDSTVAEHSNTINQTQIQTQPPRSIWKIFKKSYGEYGVGGLATFFKDVYKETIPVKTKQTFKAGTFGISTKVMEVASNVLAKNKQFWTGTPAKAEAFQTLSFLSLGAGSTPKGLGNANILITKPIRQREPSFALEKTYMEVNLNTGKSTTIGEYKIFTEKQPPRVQYLTTINRQSKGLEPYFLKKWDYKQYNYLPSVKSETSTPFRASATEGFITLEKKGGKVGKLSLVEGQSKPVNVQTDILSPTDQFLANRLAQARAKGTPVSSKLTNEIISKNDMQVFSDIQSTNFGKVRLLNKDNSRLDIFPKGQGRTITRSRALTNIKALSETEQKTVFAEQTVFLDTTFPRLKNPRVNTQTPELKTLHTHYNEPVIVGEVPTNIISPNTNIVKTPFDKTFAIQEAKQLYFISKSPPPKVPKARMSSKQLPSYQLLSVKTLSVYLGTGQYERTTGGALPSTTLQSVSLNVKTFQTNFPSQSDFADFKQSNFQSLSNPTLFKENTKINQKSASLSMSKSISKNMFKESTITKNPSKEVTINKEITKTVQKQTPKLITKNILKPIFKNPDIIIPKSPPPKSSTSTNKRGYFSFKSPNPFSSGNGGGYNVFSKRFGKWFQIGTASNPKQAFNIGTGYTQKTLARSFSVTGGNLAGGYLPRGYRVRNKGGRRTFLEPISQALNTGMELGDIQLFKSMKGGRKKK